MSRFSFGKSEKLCSKLVIEKLFSEGNSFVVFPLKFVWVKHELCADTHVKSAFTVSKKSFKRAVKRNLLKRRMREAFRLNKPDFIDRLPKSDDAGIGMMVIFLGKELMDYSRIERAMNKGLQKMTDKIQSTP
ncbi:ribonuclease P protein component [Puteibacter caeruleilacunae]|nr:ribonuclease P protein component [Puteibacter caeruleilacunae]